MQLRAPHRWSGQQLREGDRRRASGLDCAAGRAEGHGLRNRWGLGGGEPAQPPPRPASVIPNSGLTENGLFCAVWGTEAPSSRVQAAPCSRAGYTCMPAGTDSSRSSIAGI